MGPKKKSTKRGNKKPVFRPQPKGEGSAGRISSLLEDAVEQMNAGKYGRASAALKKVLAIDPEHQEALRIFATLHLKLGSLMAAKTSFETLSRKAIKNKDYRLAESLLREYLAVAPRYVPFLELLGNTLEANGHFMAAVAEYGKAIEVLNEDSDSDLMSKGRELFDTINRIGPDSNVAKKLAPLFEGEPVSAESLETPIPVRQETAEPVSSPPIYQSRDEGVSAPFPWTPTDAPEFPLVEDESSFAMQTEDVETRQVGDNADETPIQDPLPWEMDEVSGDDSDTTAQIEVDSGQQMAADLSQAEVSPKEEGSGEFFADAGGVEPAFTTHPLESIHDPLPWEKPADGPEPSTEPPSVRDALSPSDAAIHDEQEATTVAENLDAGASENTGIETEAEAAGLERNETVDPLPWEEGYQAVSASSSLDSTSTSSSPTISSEESESGSSQESASSGFAFSTPEQDSSAFAPFPWESTEESHDIPIADAADLSGELLEPMVSDESSEAEIQEESPASVELNVSVDESERSEEGTATISPAEEVTERSEGIAETADEGNAVPDDDPSPLFETLEEKPVEQAAEEAVAALQGSQDFMSDPLEIPGAGSPFGGTGTLQLQDLPHGSEQQGDEHVLAEAATEALTALEETRTEPEPPLIALPGSETSSSPSDVVSEEQPDSISIEPILPGPQETDWSEDAGNPPAIHEPVDEESPSIETIDLAPSLTTEEAVGHSSGSSFQEDSKTEEVGTIPPSPWDSQDEESYQDPAYVALMSDDQEESVAETPQFPSTIQFARSDDTEQVETSDQLGSADSLESVESGSFSTVSEDAVDFEAPPLSEESEQEAPVPVPSRRAKETGPTWVVGDKPARSGQKESQKILFPTANRIRLRAKVFTRRVVSTVRALTFLALTAGAGIGILGLIGIGITSLVWVAVEERPSESFHEMTKIPSVSSLDLRENGYQVLRQLGILTTQYPIGMEGREEWLSPQEKEGLSQISSSSVFATLHTWYDLSNPIAEFKNQRSQLRAWSSQFGSELSKYHQWPGKSFEDIGFQSLEAPHEERILAIHRLYLAEGFAGSLSRGIDRLSQDVEAWRHALAQAKTLRIKMLALEAVRDDLILLSALLGDPRLDRTFLPTLAQVGRPISHHERSLRWPIQNQFILEVQQVKAHLRSKNFPERPFYQKALTYLPLPQQKVLNAHAVFSEKLVKHDAMLHVEGDPRKGMPDRYALVNSPVQSFSDYFINPVDNLLVVQPKVDWRMMTGRLIELDARLRLIGLQARIRRSPETNDPISHIARAGQKFYDPFTGYTMLLNAHKTRIYSVGRDGVDNDGDPALDVTVPLFSR